MSAALALTRVCNRCGAEKALEAFEPAKRYKHGRMPVCRSCRSEYRAALAERPKVTGPTKLCLGCEITQSVDEFHRERRSPDGLNNRCRSCRAAMRAGEDPRVNRDRFLRWRYGITADDYDAMYEAQGGVCKVCGEGQRQERRESLDVDHCHTSGRVRGLLCSECNRALGLLEDNPERIAALLRYVEETP